MAKLMLEAVLNSKVEWVDLDYLEGCRLIALNKGEEWCRGSKLSRVLPRRRVKAGKKEVLRRDQPQEVMFVPRTRGGASSG